MQFFSLSVWIKRSLLLIICSSVTSCNNQTDKQLIRHLPVAIGAADECHLCGMVISQFPGPKGEIYDKRSESFQKFCSTKELFSWYLQPENKYNTAEIFVHDMSKSGWLKPDDGHLINAKKAWYVTGSKLTGSMGATLASFATKQQAENFSVKNGGRVLKFAQINLYQLAEPEYPPNQAL